MPAEATTIAILGPGGVGGLLAAALTESPSRVRVSVVATRATTEKIRADGLTVTSTILGELVARPEATERLEQPVDLLFVATKATGLAAALERIAAAPGMVIPLLNGLDHLTLLRNRFDAVPAAVIRVESDRPEPARIVHTSPSARIDLAAEDPALAARLPAVVDLLNEARVPAQLGRSEADVMWGKLVRLNALACTTSAFDRPLGEIRADPDMRAALRACVEEAAAVANADGASIDPSDTWQELETAHPGLGSSMQRDLAAGREPELDAIQGAVLRAARRHGLPCPTVGELSERIRVRAGA